MSCVLTLDEVCRRSYHNYTHIYIYIYIYIYTYMQTYSTTKEPRQATVEPDMMYGHVRHKKPNQKVNELFLTTKEHSNEGSKETYETAQQKHETGPFVTAFVTTFTSAPLLISSTPKSVLLHPPSPIHTHIGL